jgi:hypothetical protein
VTDFSFQCGFFPADAGGSPGVLPEVRLAGLAFKMLELVVQAGEVKDAPEVQ